MKIPTIKGIIDRRMLVNYTVDPEVIKKILPSAFSPKIVNGKAIAGICLIRLKYLRPKGFPAFIGMGSENGAHRIAVQWMENGEMKEGVYIPRRDTDSRFNVLVGGRIFPGKHYLAKFDNIEQGDNYHIAFKSSDDTEISVDAKLADTFPKSSIFDSLDAASAFFKTGAIGYSPGYNDQLDGLELHTYNWEVKPLIIKNVISSFFEDQHIFPKGSVQFDNALLMTNIEHEWHSVKMK
jgi:hypothetical protein